MLSSPKYRKLVERARERGFEIRIIYVVLESAQLQIERVRIRVEEGGHDVPVEKTIARRLRSFEQLVWFAARADGCYVYDNSTGEPQLLAAKAGESLLLWDRLPDDLRTTFDTAGVQLIELYLQ